MAFAQIERHLLEIGIKRSTPVADAVQQQIESAIGFPLPPTMKWLLSRFGGFKLSGPVFYFDPRAGEDVMLGWFLGPDELLDAVDSFGEALPADVLAIANDGSDSLLCVGVGPVNAGVVFFYEHGRGVVHDGPDSPLYRVADSLGQFLLSLHREADGAS
jgi:hypothetical protein